MTQTQVELDKIRMARDLREIRRLYGHLQQQAAATAHGRDASNNDAINASGPAAVLDHWHDRYATAQDAAYATNPIDKDWHTRNGGKDYGTDQLDAHHPLLVLADAEDRIREKLGTPTTRRATVHDAALFIGSSITWMYDLDLYGQPQYAGVNQLLADLSACRTRLENILKDGIRHERTETPCPEDGCNRVLVKVYQSSANLDHYKCPTHKVQIDYPTYVGIRHQHMYSATADDTWLSVSDAAKSSGRTNKTIMAWTYPRPSTVPPYDGKARVQYRRVGPMRRIEVKWDDVRQADLDAKRRKRAKEIA